jgi:hypothetical protein
MFILVLFRVALQKEGAVGKLKPEMVFQNMSTFSFVF